MSNKSGYECPICGFSRFDDRHTPKCSRIMQARRQAQVEKRGEDVKKPRQFYPYFSGFSKSGARVLS